MDCKKIGEYIKSKRKRIGLTQAELGDKLGVTSKAVSKWETGVALPDVSLFIELSSILKIEVYELLNGEDNHKLPSDKKKNILIVILSIFLVLFLISSLFLGIYFIKTYDTVNVYELVSENSSFHVDGKLIEIGDTSYVSISNVEYLPEYNNSYYVYDIDCELYYEDELLYSYGDINSYYFVDNRKSIIFSDLLDSILVFKEIEEIDKKENPNLDYISLKINALNEDMNIDSFVFKLEIK